MKLATAPLRCLTFEITSTLVCMSVPLGRVYGDAVRHYQLPCPDDDTMKAAFKAAYGRTNAELPNFGAAALANEREWWREMIRSTLDEAGCAEALEERTFPLVFQRIYSSFASPDVWSPCPEGQRAMRHAKQRGLVVGVCSNVYPRYVDQNLPLLGLHHDLDFAAISYELGEMKPSRAVFDEAARRASHVSQLLHGSELEDVAPEQVLHVGDDVKKDYLAARAAGMQALLFDPAGKITADAAAEQGVPPSDVIRSLDEVPGRIDTLMRAAE